MDKEKLDRLKEIVGDDAGMKVPEGFFENKFKEIQASLPPYPEAPKPERLSPWHRLRPYVYMAAMFAGIWLMMQLFHRVSAPETLSLDNIPAQVAQAMSSESDLPEFIGLASAPTDDYELETQVADAYGDMDTFEDDFGYDLQPEYEDMQVE